MKTGSPWNPSIRPIRMRSMMVTIILEARDVCFARNDAVDMWRYRNTDGRLA